jgi:hypothetical protein
LRSIAEECDAIARPLDDNYFDFWVQLKLDSNFY